MSFIKPDIMYDPKDRNDMYTRTTNNTIVPEIPNKVITSTKEEVVNTLHLFSNSLEDMDFIRFYNISNVTFKTSINVLDSISFIERFLALYIGSLKKNFPSKDFKEVEDSCELIKKQLDNILKHDNVENKFLIPMMIGILESLLNFENY